MVILPLIIRPRVWLSVAWATVSAAMLPPAPTRFSTITGCPSALDKGSARVRAIRSGDDPPGKPTTMRSVLFGQLAGLWARAGRVRPLKVRPRAWRREMEVGMAAAPRIANQYKGQQCAPWRGIAHLRKDQTTKSRTDPALGGGSCRGASGELGQRLLHFLHRRHLDLADALGAHLVLGGQLVQGHAARAIVIDLEPALFHDAAAAFVQAIECAGNAIAGQHVALAGLDHGGRLMGRIGQVGDGAKGLVGVFRRAR